MTQTSSEGSCIFSIEVYDLIVAYQRASDPLDGRVVILRCALDHRTSIRSNVTNPLPAGGLMIMFFIRIVISLCLCACKRFLVSYESSI